MFLRHNSLLMQLSYSLTINTLNSSRLTVHTQFQVLDGKKSTCFSTILKTFCPSLIRDDSEKLHTYIHIQHGNV